VHERSVVGADAFDVFGGSRIILNMSASERMSTVEILQLSVRPSFLMPFRIRLVQVTHQSEHDSFVLEVVDEMGLEPGTQIQLDTEIARAVIADFAGLRFLPFPSYLVGLDGTRYALKFGHWPGSLTIEWWASIPDEWAELERPLAQLIAFAGVDTTDFRRTEHSE
jgi:hypothetical protein